MAFITCFIWIRGLSIRCSSVIKVILNDIEEDTSDQDYTQKHKAFRKKETFSERRETTHNDNNRESRDFNKSLVYRYKKIFEEINVECAKRRVHNKMHTRAINNKAREDNRIKSKQ